MKREDEELCRSIFDHHLLTLCDQEEVRWTDGDEPPDFYVEIAGIELAVEVTSLVERISTHSGGEVSQLSILFPLKELIEGVAASARQGGYLNGGYLVVFRDPFGKLARIRGKLEKELLRYIHSTQAGRTAPEQMIYQQDSQECSITKVHDQTGEVQMLWNLGAINVDGIAADICRLLRGILHEKTCRLRNVPNPKILIVRDLYGFGGYGLSNINIRRRCAETLVGALSTFRAVFVVHDDTRGLPFHPEESRWNRSLFVGVSA